MLQMDMDEKNQNISRIFIDMGLCCEPGEMETTTAKHRPGDLKKLAPDYELRKQVTTLFAQKGLGEDDGMPMETAIPLL